MEILCDIGMKRKCMAMLLLLFEGSTDRNLDNCDCSRGSESLCWFEPDIFGSIPWTLWICHFVDIVGLKAWWARRIDGLDKSMSCLGLKDSTKVGRIETMEWTSL